jgi:hypothetical protein
MLGLVRGRADDFCEAVAVAGDYAYAAYTNSESEPPGILVVDVATPQFAPIVGSVGTPGWINDVHVSGTHAYVADRDFHVLDISNPQMPVVVGALATPGDGRGVTVSGAHAYVADGAAGLRVIAVTNPALPQLVGSVDTPGSSRGVAVSGTHAYVADWNFGLQVIDILNPQVPAIVTTVDPPGGDSQAVVVFGNYAYVACGWSGLRVFDVANPGAAHLSGSTLTGSYAIDVEVSEGYAYVANSWDGLAVIDISNPATPQFIESVDEGHSIGVEISGTTAYVTDADFGLQVFDITIPGDPRLIGGLDVAIEAQKVALSDTHIMFVGGNQLYTGSFRVLPLQCAPLPVAADPETFRGVVQQLRLYPNPATTRVIIPFSADHRGPVLLTAHDVAGREVARIFEGVIRPGARNRVWDVAKGRGERLAAGVYFVRLVTQDGAQEGKIVLMPE